jgi:hypothetical protein
MADERRVDVGGGREAVVKPELKERPALGPVTAIVKLAAPWWPGRPRKKMIAFIDGLVAAFRVRARDETDLEVTEAGSRVVVRRRLAGGGSEVRLERESRTHATFYCDRRELENLSGLGILAGARVIKPLKKRETAKEGS